MKIFSRIDNTERNFEQLKYQSEKALASSPSSAFSSFHFISDQIAHMSISFILLVLRWIVHRRKWTNNRTLFSLFYRFHSTFTYLRRASHVVVIDFALKMNWEKNTQPFFAIYVYAMVYVWFQQENCIFTKSFFSLFSSFF